MVISTIYHSSMKIFSARNLLKTFITVLVIAFCFFFPHLGLFPIFIYPLIVLLVVWLFLKFISRENFKDLLFSFKRFNPISILIGIFVAVLLTCFFKFIWNPAINYFIPAGEINLTDFSNVRHNTANYVFIMFMALLVGGFYEEIIFHGFIFTRIEKFLNNRHAIPVAVVVTNVIFGAYHFQQGIKGVLLTTIAGLAYHLVILKFKRNLWYGLFAHAFFDFIGLTFIYIGYL